MSRNLASAGYDVYVWNRSAHRHTPDGCSRCSSISEAVHGADAIFAMVADPAAAKEVALGNGGVASCITPQQAYIDCSTIDPHTAAHIHRGVNATGAKVLEAPVAGSKGPAENGQLIFITAGSKEVNTYVQPLLDVMGKKTVFFGETPGTSSQAKLINNCAMSSILEAYAESLALAQASNVDMDAMREVMENGAFACPMFGLKAPNMQSGEHPPAFPAKHAQKDLNLGLSMANEYQQSMPVVAATNQKFIDALRHSWGDHDFSAVFEESVDRQQ